MKGRRRNRMVVILSVARAAGEVEGPMADEILRLRDPLGRSTQDDTFRRYSENPAPSEKTEGFPCLA